MNAPSKDEEGMYASEARRRADRLAVQAAELADAEDAQLAGLQSTAWRAWPWSPNDVVRSVRGGVTVRLLDGDPAKADDWAATLEVAQADGWRTAIVLRSNLDPNDRKALAQAIYPEGFGLVPWRPGYLADVADLPKPPEATTTDKGA